jgi:hypothetical protein
MLGIRMKQKRIFAGSTDEDIVAIIAAGNDRRALGLRYEIQEGVKICRDQLSIKFAKPSHSAPSARVFELPLRSARDRERRRGNPFHKGGKEFFWSGRLIL